TSSHGAVPLQPPPANPTNAESVPAVAVSVSAVLSGNSPPQASPPHETSPRPSPASKTVSRRRVSPAASGAPSAPVPASADGAASRSLPRPPSFPESHAHRP